ncbi:MAG: energy transducer TonB [Flavobacteriaceae bacterium]|nr:energy transducer TonB [Flavobacteriaceae bacterium]
MGFLDTPHKKKSAMLTSIITLLLLLVFSWIGLSYFDPPISYGMEVNFGMATQGKGTTQPKTPPRPVEQEIQQEQIKSSFKSPKVSETNVSEVLTQKDNSVPIIPKKEVLKSSENTSDQNKNKKVEEAKKVSPPKPTVSNSTKNILSNLLNNKNQKGDSKEGEGDDDVPGDKGKEEGNPYASSYYGSAGLGGKGNGFGLNGRNLQNQGSVTQQCNQEGVVVVRITVDKSGAVISAEPGVKGTTNSHPCLLEPAKKTAYLHKWFADSNAPTKQVGFVVVKFKIGE